MNGLFDFWVYNIYEVNRLRLLHTIYQENKNQKVENKSFCQESREEIK